MILAGGGAAREVEMRKPRLPQVVLMSLLLAAATSRVIAQSANDPNAKKSVYGKLESVDTRLNGVFMRSDQGKRLAWRFDKKVIEEMARFHAGDPMIVIYRQISSNEKRVTAVAFPGSADGAVYVNLTGSRILLRSAPMKDGACGAQDAGPVVDSVIPAGGRGEAEDACWCCSTTDATCNPANKTGKGIALLSQCFE
jgi:hypothetical protein